jgi:anti-sigma B factor antagonist
MAGLGEGASSALRIESSRDAAGDPLLKLSGELDLLAADSLRRAIDNALDAVPERLVFDVSELRFIDSAGLAVLIEASSRDGSVELRSPSAAVRRAVELTGLSDVLRLVG